MVNIVIVGGGTSRSDGGTKHFWQIFSDVIMVIHTDNVCQGNQHNVLQSAEYFLGKYLGHISTCLHNISRIEIYH